MSPKRKNDGLPKRWRFKNGAYRYQVPKGQEHLWDGKTEFTLGKTETEAYRVWSERLQLHKNARTISDALERYLIDVVPHKAYSTQESNQLSIKRLNKVFGHMSILGVKPKHAFAYRDEVAKKHGKPSANRDIEVLSHLFSMCVEWGLIDRNPIKGQIKKFPIQRRERYVEDWEINAAYSVANPIIKAYIVIKLLTGLRRCDILRLTASNLKEDGIHVQPSKTRNSTGAKIIIEWSDELREAVNNAKKSRPKDVVPWLFCTRNGKPYINEKGKANAFDSMWQRFMKKVLKQTDISERFQEKDLRKKTCSDMDLTDAKNLLCHASVETTKRHYRIKGELVKPHSLKPKK